MRIVWVVAAWSLAACTPRKLIDATVSYAGLSDATFGELGTVPGLVTDLCVQRAQLEYMTVRVTGGKAPTTFAEFYAKAESVIGLPGAKTITWKQHCGGYRVADDAFEAGLGSIAAYGGALRDFATENATSQQGLEAIAASATTSAAALSATDAQYKDALGGLATPIGMIADAAKVKWKARKLRGLVDKTDPALQEAIRILGDFVGTVRSRQVRDLREALDVLRDDLEEIREATGSKPYKIDLVTAMMIDIQMTERITQMESRLTALVELLKQLGAAHTELRKGWDAGEDMGTDTLKTMRVLGKAIYDDIKAFRSAKGSPQ